MFLYTKALCIVKITCQLGLVSKVLQSENRVADTTKYYFFHTGLSHNESERVKALEILFSFMFIITPDIIGDII